MSMPATKSGSQPAAPVLLGLRELVAVFPSVKENTIYRWNTPRTNGQTQLPAPHLRVSGTPMWTEEQIRSFAVRKSLDVDDAALASIRESQRS